MVNAHWEARAKEAKEVYGAYVDWEERFYICPWCEEPVYECDWDNGDLIDFLCPICEDDGVYDGYEDYDEEDDEDEEW